MSDSSACGAADLSALAGKDPFDRTTSGLAIDQARHLAHQLACQIDEFILEHPAAAVLEDGSVVFDLRFARCSAAESHSRCILQLWSEERNIVRTVLSVERRTGCLRLMTRRLGAAKPASLELVPTRDQRTPTARENGRRQYLRLVGRVLQRTFPEWQTESFRSAADLEHSFGPAYARGHLLRGPSAEAVIGIGAEESSAAIDRILTLGLLWLDHCRERSAGRPNGSRHFGRLKVIVPAGQWRATAERMVWLNHKVAAFQLFTLDERSEELVEIDFRDLGNVESRLTHAFDVGVALARAQFGLARFMQLIPHEKRSRVEIRPRSAAEVGLLLHGLEFARVRNGVATRSFASEEEITFGAGANETLLTDENEGLCREMLARLFESRKLDGSHTDPLFRLQPERWLESQIRLRLDEVLPGLRGEFLYTQVPAISSGDRGMLDLLTVDQAGRLIVIEVKADDDMHLPLQGLDYWIRVRALNADRKPDGNRQFGAFERQGYFAGAEIAPRAPKLLLIAPALRIHPSNEIVLRYLAPEVEWELIAMGEHWRHELKVLFRKRSQV